MAGPKVLVVGNNTVDSVYELSGSIRMGEKVSAVRFGQYYGGQAANVAFTLASMGIGVQYIGAFGNDQEGRNGRESLTEVGVDLSGSVIISDCYTQRATVMVDAANGERSIVLHKDGRLNLKPGIVNRISSTDLALVYTDNHDPTGSWEAASLAASYGLPMLADLERVDSQTRKILPLLSSIIAPAGVIRELAGDNDLESALASVCHEGPRIAVATAGPEGALALSDQGCFERVPAQKCKVRDTTGAGDAFHAGYMAAILAGKGFREALELATSLAALKCTHLGPRVSPDSLRSWSRQHLGRPAWRSPERGFLI